MSVSVVVIELMLRNGNISWKDEGEKEEREMGKEGQEEMKEMEEDEEKTRNIEWES